MTDLTHKVALVTGGARRVGRALALALAQAGMDVAITYRLSGDEAAEVVAAIKAMGRRAAAFAVDLAEPDAAESVYARFTSTFDRLDALINNASLFEPSPLAELSPDAFARHMAVNALSPLLLIRRFAPLLAAHAVVDESTEPAQRQPTRHAGRVVNFIDIHVLGQPLKGYIAYNASKAALYEITKTLALELAPKVTVNAIAPGVIKWAESYTPDRRRLYMKRVPLQYPGTPQDAAAAVLYLVRDADYCTGQVIRLDGGRLWT